MIEMNFRKDLEGIYRAALKRLGCKTKPEDDVHELGFKFYNSVKRRISIRPRKIAIADTFQPPAKDSERLGFEKLKKVTV